MATPDDTSITVEPSEDTGSKPTSNGFGPDPAVAKCPECDHTGETDVFYEPGVYTYGLCLLLLFMGMWLGCFAIPFCVPSAKDCVHKCSHCGAELGRFRRYEKEIREPYT